MRQIILIAVAGLWTSLPSPARPPVDFTPLEQAIEQQMKSQGVPGVAVAVFAEGRICYAKGFGVTNVENPSPVTPDTLFRLGSTAKIFTAASLLKMAQQGRVHLEAPISTYVAGLPERMGRVTLLHLLSNTAGLRDDAPQDGPHDETALEANVRSWTDQMLFSEPGRIFSYANTGYVLAGYVLERVAAKRFADAVEELVLTPAGMTRSTYRPFVAVTYPFALGHQPGPRVIRPFPDHAGSWPPGSLFSNARDMARFLMTLLDGGRYEGREALPASLTERLLEPISVIEPFGVRYGWGSIFSDAGGRRAVYLPGGRAGFGSAYYLVPEKRAGAIIMTNLSGVNFRRFAQQAVELIAPPDRRPEPQQLSPALTMKRDEMASYSGKYFNSPPIQTELAVRDDTLQIRAGSRWITVEKTGAGRFRAPGGGQLENFQLVLGPDGSPEFLLAEAWALPRVKQEAK